MGYSRGIIRRGFRSDDQQVPQISPADMLRIMGDPSPDEEMMNLPPNAKRTRYAWLLDGEKPAKKKRPKKNDTEALERHAEPAGPVDPALSQTTVEQPPPEQAQKSPQAVPPNHYPHMTLYASPYRQVTASGGLVISSHPLDPNQDIGQHASPEGSLSVSMTPRV